MINVADSTQWNFIIDSGSLVSANSWPIRTNSHFDVLWKVGKCQVNYRAETKMSVIVQLVGFSCGYLCTLAAGRKKIRLSRRAPFQPAVFEYKKSRKSVYFDSSAVENTLRIL
jgi:hypothetical protein